MSSFGSAFERRHQNKPSVVLDACIFLAAFDPDDAFHNCCKNYLTQAGTQYRPIFIKTVSGELFHAIFKSQDAEVRSRAYGFMSSFFDSLRRKPLRSVFVSGDVGLEAALADLSIFTHIPLDDRIHLASTLAVSRRLVAAKRTTWSEINSPLRFATIDEKVKDEKTVSKLSSMHLIKIIGPGEMI